MPKRNKENLSDNYIYTCRFRDRRDAKWVIENWRKRYNEEQPHSAIEYEIPSQRRRYWELNQQDVRKKSA
jgi:hypothetical protein